MVITPRKWINNLTDEIPSQGLTMENSSPVSALEVSEGLHVDAFHFFYHVHAERNVAD